MSSVSFFQLLRSKLSELSEFRRKTGAIRRDWGAVLNAADLDASTSQGTQGRLTTRTRGLGAPATSATDLNVQGSDTELLAASGNILGCKHRGIWGRLITISLHLHASCHTNQGLTTSEIGNVDEGVVVRSVDVSHTEHFLARLQLLGENVKLDLTLHLFGSLFISFFGHFGLIDLVLGTLRLGRSDRYPM